MFLLCMADTHGLFTPALDLIARSQEMVMLRDNAGLLRALVSLKEIVDQLPYAFHKISVNPGAGENFADPVRLFSVLRRQSSSLQRLNRYDGPTGTPNSVLHCLSEYQRSRAFSCPCSR